jgi:predicted PurR-regulated permease PerM
VSTYYEETPLSPEATEARINDTALRLDPEVMVEYAYVPQWSRSLRLLALGFLVVGGALTFGFFSAVGNLVIISLLLTMVMFRPVRFITTRSPLTWGLSTFLIYLLLVMVVVGLILVVLPPLINGGVSLLSDVQDGYADLQQRLREFVPAQHGVIEVIGITIDITPVIEPLRDFLLQSEGGAGSLQDIALEDLPLDQPANLGTQLLSSLDLQALLTETLRLLGFVTGTVSSLVVTLAQVLSTLLLSVFISFLITLDMPGTGLGLSQTIPAVYEREITLLLTRIWRLWNGFFRGQFTIALLIGVFTWAQLLVMGVPNAELLAVFTALISLIPTVGGLIALVPLFIVPLLQGSNTLVNLAPLPLALLVIGINVIFQQIMWNLLAPKILGDVLDLPMPVVLIGVFAGAAAYGLLGAFLVAPVIGSVVVIVRYLLAKIGGVDPYPREEPTRMLDEAFRAARGDTGAKRA